MMDEPIMKQALAAQRREVTEEAIYARLSKSCAHAGNAKVLADIAASEAAHAAFWKGKTGRSVEPDRWAVARTVLMARTLGLTFALKLMERGEARAGKAYAALSDAVPEAMAISRDEEAHEQALLALLDEERLAYVGSIVLGLNDALVELTGALAGFTLALSDTRIISAAGLVTGVSAAFSMAASDYLSSKAQGDPRAKKSALYTGVAYIATVAALILPFLLVPSRFLALGITLGTAILIIAGFNYYLSVAKDLDFKRRFAEMSLISLGVAALSFGIGYVLSALLGVKA
jgi:VIT1/CCC1 family predicted Fe2+/Mn2+ transporter